MSYPAFSSLVWRTTDCFYIYIYMSIYPDFGALQSVTRKRVESGACLGSRLYPTIAVTKFPNTNAIAIAVVVASIMN